MICVLLFFCSVNRQRSEVTPSFWNNGRRLSFYFTSKTWVMPGEYLGVAHAHQGWRSPLKGRAHTSPGGLVWSASHKWFSFWVSDARKFMLMVHKYWSRFYSTGLKLSHTQSEKHISQLFPPYWYRCPRITLPWQFFFFKSEFLAPSEETI